jgi:endonuclease YncB( thermonuclease family)
MPRKPPLLVVFIFLVFLFVPALCLAQNLTGKVISVADGDTITILTATKQQIKIRLYGIDTPESGQAFGQKAKQFTSSLVYGKPVEIKAYDIDKYGRTVGVVLVNGRNVNEEVIRAGYAWQYRKYCQEAFCTGWLALEESARNSKLGLWHDKNPTPPWEWRKASKGANTPTSLASSLPSSSSRSYHGNIKSHVLHSPGCQHYNCTNCTASFSSVDSALRAGYRVHEQCVR